MPLPAINVTIDASQFPDRVAEELKRSLRDRQVNHKFHYDSYKQTEKWLALRRRYAPFHTDAKCAEVYQEGFRAAAAILDAPSVHVVGLGCGGGEKECQLLDLLKGHGKEVWYSPVDVSAPLVIAAHQNATRTVPVSHCQPIVCDLSQTENLPQLLEQHAPGNVARIFTFFGMIPNFEPAQIMPRLASLLKPNDVLLFSANLAPGTDYDAGMRKILPLYDNPETRDWFLIFLLDLGVELSDGELRFSIEDFSHSLKGIVARFQFQRSRSIQALGETFSFQPNDAIRLFFSCRHTPELVSAIFSTYGLEQKGQWLNDSQEEGVFLAGKRFP